MRVINGILFYSEQDVKGLPKGKTLADITPKKKFFDTRKIEDCFYTRPHKVLTKEGIQEVTQKFENTPGINRRERRAREQSVRKKGTDLAAFQRKVLKRRGKYKKPELLTPRKWIAKLYRSGVSKKEIRKMHNECRNETGSRLLYKTFSTYVTEVKK